MSVTRHWERIGAAHGSADRAAFDYRANSLWAEWTWNGELSDREALASILEWDQRETCTRDYLLAVHADSRNIGAESRIARALARGYFRELLR